MAASASSPGCTHLGLHKIQDGRTRECCWAILQCSSFLIINIEEKSLTKAEVHVSSQIGYMAVFNVNMVVPVSLALFSVYTLSLLAASLLPSREEMASLIL